MAGRSPWSSTGRCSCREGHRRICGRRFLPDLAQRPDRVGFRTADIEALLRRYRGLLVVDETYAVFADECATDLVARHPNLCVVRTFRNRIASPHARRICAGPA